MLAKYEKKAVLLPCHKGRVLFVSFTIPHGLGRGADLESFTLILSQIQKENDSRGIEDHHGRFGCENIDDIMSDPKVVVFGRDIEHVWNYIAHVMRSRII